MEINWKVRFKNPLFWSQITMAAFMPILAYSGLTAKDLSTWQAVFETVKGAFSNPYVLGLTAVSVWNAVNDPTTKGMSDSLAAMEYEAPKEDR